MSYRFKGDRVIFNGGRTTLIAQPLPQNPYPNEIIIDEVDDKLKVWNESLQ